MHLECARPRLRLTAITGSAAAAALLALAAPAVANASPRPADASGSAAPASAGTYDYLNSNSCVPGTSFCMTVGAYWTGTRYAGLAEVLSDGTWATKYVPSPAVDRNIFANEVSCATTTRCVFVGQHYRRHAGADLAEAWNGTAWKIITASGPRGSTVSSLNDVSCPSARGCLVVGVAYTGRRYHAIAFTWADGRTWRQIRVPGPRGARDAELAALSCADATYCMAMGNYINAAGKNVPYAIKWHNGAWKVLRVPDVPGATNPYLQGDSCPTVRLCVAAGATTAAHRPSRGFFDIYRDGRWYLAATLPADTGMLGASCPTMHTCLLSGFTGSQALVEAWGGGDLANLDALQTSGIWPSDYFEHVSCASLTSCEAVGARYNNNRDHTLAEFWDGSTWSIQATVNP